MEPTGSHPDSALAARAADGDESAWREIYTATRERLFSLLVYQIGDREEALDVLQETYLHAVKGIRGYQGRASLESWLCGIALRRSLGWKRRVLGRLKRTQPLSDDPDAAGGRPPADPDEGRRLREALGRLPERQRSAVLLHDWIGYSFEEIGAMLGISEATARVHAFRGRETLRGLIAETDATFPAPSLQEERS
jgi:RNA polymerase sigma-70 factor (ECF subfamily)